MGWQIIKQPDGKFCIQSSVTDAFIAWDATEVEVVNFFVEEELRVLERTKQKVRDKIKMLNEGKKPYHQFTLSFEEALVDNLFYGNMSEEVKKDFEEYITQEILEQVELRKKESEE